jgi:hypothetical protein
MSRTRVVTMDVARAQGVERRDCEFTLNRCAVPTRTRVEPYDDLEPVESERALELAWAQFTSDDIAAVLEEHPLNLRHSRVRFAARERRAA